MNHFSEKIRRKDLEVARALEEKHRLVAEYYQLPYSGDQSIEDTASDTNERDAREVLLAALVQGIQNTVIPPNSRNF